MQGILVGITDFGDSAVLGVVTLVAALYLRGQGDRRGALVLLFALAVAGSTIAVLKFVFIGCGVTFEEFHIQSPSGHAALSAAVLGTLASIAAAGQQDWPLRVLPPLAAAASSLAIAATRVILRAHTPDEVVVGLAVGAGVAMICDGMVRKSRAAMGATDLRRLGVLVLAAALLLHGVRLPASDWVRMAANSHAHGGLCNIGLFSAAPVIRGWN